MKKMILLAAFIVAPMAQAEYKAAFECFKIKDYSCALKESLADKENAEAQLLIGLMYDFGQGVEIDYTEAVKWYRLAAEQGEPSAQFRLGIMYDGGAGITKDRKLAKYWYRKSCDNGNKYGCDNFRTLNSLGY